MRRMLAAAIVSIGGVAASAGASSIDIEYQGVHSQGTYHVSVNGSTSHVFAGRMDYEVVSGSHGSFTPGTSFSAFCVELDQVVRGAAESYDVHAESLADSNLGISDLSSGIATDRTEALSALFLRHFNAAVSGSKAQASAFQLATWEIVYEGDGAWDLGAGDFQVTSGDAGARTQAQSLLDEIAGLEGDYGAVSDLLVGFGSGQYQDQLTLIPLPAPAVMGLAGLAAAMVARRRMRRG